ELAVLFQKKGAVTSKFLLLVIIPLTALFFWLLTFKKRKFFYDQVIFSTEINSMYLLWGFMILPLLLTILSIIMYSVLCIYVAVAATRFYALTIYQCIGFAFLFYIIHFIVVQVLYKFLLFALVINQIH
ncbi:MAG: hypothetical protein V4676_06220, partial [Bacteroidota bacterium]